MLLQPTQTNFLFAAARPAKVSGGMGLLVQLSGHPKLQARVLRDLAENLGVDQLNPAALREAADRLESGEDGMVTPFALQNTLLELNEPVLAAIQRTVFFEDIDKSSAYKLGLERRPAEVPVAQAYQAGPRPYTKLLSRKTDVPFAEKNPLISFLSQEESYVSAKELDQARQFLLQLLHALQIKLKDGSGDPETLLIDIYHVLRQQGLQTVPADDPSAILDPSAHDVSMVRNLINHRIDGDELALLYRAIAYEFGWPLRLGVNHDHLFVVWRDKHFFDPRAYPDAPFFGTLNEMPGHVLNEDQERGLLHFHSGLLAHSLGKDPEKAAFYYRIAIEQCGLRFAPLFEHLGRAKKALGPQS